MAIHSSVLDWRIPWTEESGGLQSFRTPVRNHSRPEVCTSCTFQGFVSRVWCPPGSVAYTAAFLNTLASSKHHPVPVHGTVSHSVVSDSATPQTVACQAPLSMGFSRQEYSSGLPFPTPGESSRPRDPTQVSCVSCSGRQILYH